MRDNSLHHVVIVGGGFGGLHAAKALRRAPVRITLVDRRNFHLFQPLLYQVAAGGLSAGDIAYPLRAVFADDPQVSVLMAEVVDFDLAQRKVFLRDGELAYDTLIVATGAIPQYFGHEHWAERAPGLKGIEDALEMRRRILLAFEAAERESSPDKRRALMTFVIIGGGPTGVELAGTLGELAQSTLKHYFRQIDTAEATIRLVENSDRLLPSYPPELSAKAEAALTRLGVTVRRGTAVSDIHDDAVMLRSGDVVERLVARTVLWGAGVRASRLGEILAKHSGGELDHIGRVKVEPDLSLPGYPDVFIIGDLAHFAHQDGKPLPGLAAEQLAHRHARVFSLLTQRLPCRRSRRISPRQVLGRCLSHSERHAHFKMRASVLDKRLAIGLDGAPTGRAGARQGRYLSTKRAGTEFAQLHPRDRLATSVACPSEMRCCHVKEASLVGRRLPAGSFGRQRRKGPVMIYTQWCS
jgi:NADH:ubiquinone reductase (H+-translocating)